VVIHRLPLMMETEWKTQCRELLELPVGETPRSISLSNPGSSCPHCSHGIRWYQNIPIISYLLLRGRCANCQNPIALRYPLVELITGLLSLVIAWRYGASLQTLALLPLTWGLIALSFIDIDKQLLPDSITLPLLWLGLALSLGNVFISPAEAILGALVGYLSLWSFYWAFKLFTGKEGMGHGDFKLLALFGAWVGWKMVLLIILLSSLVGMVFGIGMILLRNHNRQIPIPFGPYLAAAGWISLLWGQELGQIYLNLAGLN
jgi:leader peptidase (prepilin peptidase)/N-methyltransferase